MLIDLDDVIVHVFLAEVREPTTSSGCGATLLRSRWPASTPRPDPARPKRSLEAVQRRVPCCGALSICCCRRPVSAATRRAKRCSAPVARADCRGFRRCAVRCARRQPAWPATRSAAPARGVAARRLHRGQLVRGGRRSLDPSLQVSAHDEPPRGRRTRRRAACVRCSSFRWPGARSTTPLASCPCRCIRDGCASAASTPPPAWRASWRAGADSDAPPGAGARARHAQPDRARTRRPPRQRARRIPRRVRRAARPSGWSTTSSPRAPRSRRVPARCARAGARRVVALCAARTPRTQFAAER